MENTDIETIIEVIDVSEKVTESEEGKLKIKKPELPSLKKEMPRGPKSPGLVPIKKNVMGKDKEGNFTSFDRTYYIDPHKEDGSGKKKEKSIDGENVDGNHNILKKEDNKSDLLSSISGTDNFDDLGKKLTEKGYGDGEFEAIKTFACNL